MLRQCAFRAARLRRRMSQDEGTTLVELMVGMVLMSVFLAMFTGAILMLSGAMNKSQAINLSASQLNVAFQNLDRAVRYASAISTPGTGTSGDWYVELRMTNTGTEVCTQLRVDIAAQQLQSRTWKVVNAAATTPTTWLPISSGITNGGAPSGVTQPFRLPVPLAVPATIRLGLDAPANALHQQLTVNLASPAGSGTAVTTSSSSFTFTALNSVLPAPTSPICQQGGRP